MADTRRGIIIGLTASWLHADEERTLYNGRTLLYMEQSMGEWLLRYGAGVPLMIPGAAPGHDVVIEADDVAEVIDGLVIQGGVDVAPQSYGQQPLCPEWSGDPIRDRYELDLLKACLDRDRPILGICRGHQVLNVALGGTLFQDIATEVNGALNHRDRERYHEHTHEVVFESGARFRQLFGASKGRVNSVHHQAINELGTGLSVEARSPDDGVIEAVRLRGDRYAVGVQWHPEFQEPHQDQLLATTPILDDFFDAIRVRRQRVRQRAVSKI